MDKKLIPGTGLLATVRAGFIAQGSSLHKWCVEHQVQYPNARQALIGSWSGPKGISLRNKIVEAARVEGDL